MRFRNQTVWLLLTLITLCSALQAAPPWQRAFIAERDSRRAVLAQQKGVLPPDIYRAQMRVLKLEEKYLRKAFRLGIPVDTVNPATTAQQAYCPSRSTPTQPARTTLSQRATSPQRVICTNQAGYKYYTYRRTTPASSSSVVMRSTSPPSTPLGVGSTRLNQTFSGQRRVVIQQRSGIPSQTATPVRQPTLAPVADSVASQPIAKQPIVTNPVRQSQAQPELIPTPAAVKDQRVIPASGFQDPQPTRAVRPSEVGVPTPADPQPTPAAP